MDNNLKPLNDFLRQYPKEAQQARVQIKQAIDEGGAPEPEEIKELLQIAQELQKNPSLWSQIRPRLIEAGMPEENMPPPNANKEQVQKMVGILYLTVHLIGQGAEAPMDQSMEQPATPPTPQPTGLIQGA